MNKVKFQNRFLEIPHKSDAAILVCGSSLPDLFKNAVDGMYHIMGMVCGDSAIGKESVQLKASDYEELLVRYLTELLYWSELNIIAIPDEIQISDCQLISTITKKPLSQKSVGIKAVTYSELKIIQKKNSFHTKIVFDL
jgi:SHS2 domain-containing protein